ncbi:MAG: phosphoribosylanthranilate isomerase [Lachnospiraceae bacterium]|nr:phosphoribosylanthranilate isomerase [Lachnospiraceae bacterium]
MPKLKICGLKRPEDIRYVNQYPPDFIGFVFAKSLRQIRPREAKELRRQLKPGIVPIGVFVNEEIENIVRLVKEGVIDMVQLHGDESAEYVRLLGERLEEVSSSKAALSHGIIKAVRVASRQDVKKALDFPADFLLFDTYTKGQYGGSGECFNWQLLKGIERPFFLAGGLKVENIAGAALEVKPFCLDVSSGAERDGKKDEEKIRRLVETIRKIEKGE